MKFKDAAAIESVTWYMRLSDYPRATNRALINDLFNGVPPYTEEEVSQNNIFTNVNFLDPTKVAMDARRQFYSSLANPSPLFRVTVDYGPKHKRKEWGEIITQQINRIMKRSAKYMELQRSQFALNVLHGIGPCYWENDHCWCPTPLGVEDVMIPTGTLLDMTNLPFLALYRRYTSMQLSRMTSGPHVDPGWNTSVVNACMDWADQNAARLMQATWPEVWSPEKMNERRKENNGLTGSDSVPTIDCWDFYFWDDDGKAPGWRRRIVLDTWSSTNIGTTPTPTHKIKDARNQFLYNSGDRKFADNMSELVHFQFADASCVAPFRYHSVRSLGFLLYSVCHLQNRLRCKFTDATFEALLQYFRTGSPDEAERVAKLVLADKAVIPDGIKFVPQEERWQINERLIMECLGLNRQTISDTSSTFTQDYNVNEGDGRETATRTMAKLNASTALLAGMVNQAYDYQQFQYYEMCRRFCIENSSDAGVKAFQLACRKQQVPKEALDHNLWDVEATRVIGGGNRMQQIAVADKLMGIRPVLDPDAQRTVDRLFISANTEDYDLAQALVPEQKKVSDARVEGQKAAAALMLGLPVDVSTGINRIDYVEALLSSTATKIQQIEKLSNGSATMDQVIGLSNLLQHAGQQVGLIGQDKNEAERSRAYMDNIKEMSNLLRGYQQRLAEQNQEAAQAMGAGENAKDAAKVQSMIIQAKTKAELARQSHAERTAQKQITWQKDEERKQQEHQMELQRKQVEAAMAAKRDADEHVLSLRRELAALKADIASKDIETAAKVKRLKMEPKPEKPAKKKGKTK